jgi:hypothetical protein
MWQNKQTTFLNSRTMYSNQSHVHRAAVTSYSLHLDS